MKTLLLTSAVLAGLFGCFTAFPPPAPFPFPVPYHAFCRALWLFATPCSQISTTIAQQIQASAPEYKLVLATPLVIRANHTSDGVQMQNITFSLTDTILTGGCRVSAESISLGFTSLLDDGLNYCNLYNVLAASGLISAPGFLEMTNEWACMGYGLAKCKA
ncbi:hypothetical protein OJAV_G00092860 [Oryzias javanicus]|uniref:Lipoprotein n=1 Tax=Oryzias javanicus TaxID=123683 RepID=A0A3S2P7M3_ORYJA|nr:hypothetical protein OJAV_G00092860 [Oryzias javanicus]